jgi:chromosomal replication initiator protein
MTAAEARADLTLPASLRSRLDGHVAEIARRAFADGKRAGKREALKLANELLHVKIIDIQRLVADRMGINIAEMTSKRRGRAVARPRQVAMYLARHLTPHSLPVIGRHFGGRDHTTVMHAISMVEERAAGDPAFSGLLNEMRAELAARLAA